MFKPPRIVIGIIAIAIVILLVLWVIPANSGEADAPETTIVCSISKVGSSDEYQAEVDVGGSDSLFTVYTGGRKAIFTTFGAEVPPLEYWGAYYIEFMVTTTITAENPGDVTSAELKGTMSGLHKGGSSWFQSGATDDSRIDWHGVTLGQSSSLDFTMANGNRHFDMISDGVGSVPILGQHIDGSVWTLDIESRIGAGSTNSTQVTINVFEQDIGEIYIEVTGVEVQTGG
jgi:hypothetical protein